MDLIELTKDRPADFDISKSQQLIFTGPEQSLSPTGVAIIFFDEGSCLDAYSGNEVFGLIRKEKIQGVAIPTAKVKDMIVSLMDAYHQLMQVNPKMDEKLKVANRMSALLSDLKLM